MSFDIDEKEFYETFAEITQDRGLEEAKRWAWSALDWTQQELRKEATKSQSILAEERAAVVAHLRERATHGSGNTITVEDACTILANLFERGEHRREEEE